MEGQVVKNIFFKRILLIYSLSNLYLFIVIVKPFDYSINIPYFNKDLYLIVIPLILNFLLFVTTIYLMTVELFNNFKLFKNKKILVCYINVMFSYKWILFFLNISLDAYFN